jgi:hypothetical protein
VNDFELNPGILVGGIVAIVSVLATIPQRPATTRAHNLRADGGRLHCTN